MKKILICGVNWLGDGIMSMPAVSAFKKAHPEAAITMLLKKNMMPLWEMCPAVDNLIELGNGLAGTVRSVEAAAAEDFDAAYVFPNSFRAALVPFLAGIPRRRGLTGHKRSILLTESVGDSFEDKHQLLEYMAILELDHEEHDTSLEKLKVRLTAGEAARKYVGAFEDDVANIVGMIPGAAYGPAKMWPARNYIEVGKKLIDEKGCRIIVMGVEPESEICLRISEELGQAAICLAGETSLAESAALLSDCRVVICNDSGGMHLAAAAGTAVVAVFGITDPTKTGPLGDNHKLIMADDVQRSRDLDRESPEAIEALSSINPERVYEAAVELLK